MHSKFDVAELEVSSICLKANVHNPCQDEFDSFSKIELDENYRELLNIEKEKFDFSPIETDINIKVTDYVLDNTVRDGQGRLIMPLIWNASIKHRLAKNFFISKQILGNSLKVLSKIPDGLKKVDQIFREQEQLGIIKRIPDLNKFMEENPSCSFLPHKPVVRTGKTSTKIRMVFMPNLKEKSPNADETFSMNQCMLAGLSLNHKITTAIQLLRFENYLLVFDIKKAFLQIGMSEIDQSRLAFLWFKDVNKENHEIVAFQNARLPFGLKCSPAILMLGLYRALVEDAVDDPVELQDFKKQIFNNFYVDNGGLTFNSDENIKEVKEKIEKILAPYKFSLQQFAINHEELQEEFDKNEEEKTEDVSKLLGVQWNRKLDSIGPKQPQLNPNATTKREILKTLNGVYDVLGLYLPVVLRAKLFLQKINNEEKLKWDDVISEKNQRKWKNICKFVNNSEETWIERSMGSRSDTYSLICFTDAGAEAYGCVIYLYNSTQNKLSFLSASNHLLNKQLKNKTIPELEMKAVAFGVRKLIDAKRELCGAKVVLPLKIESLNLYSDSLVTLQRIHSLLYQFDKLKSPSIFVKNLLQSIKLDCDRHPIKFSFVDGKENLADYVTKYKSYRILKDTNYYTGPVWIGKEPDDLRYTVTIPHPLAGTSTSDDDVPGKMHKCFGPSNECLCAAFDIEDSQISNLLDNAEENL